MRNWVCRTVKNGKVRIYGHDFAPRESGPLEGLRLSFRIAWIWPAEGDSPLLHPACICFGREEWLKAHPNLYADPLVSTPEGALYPPRAAWHMTDRPKHEADRALPTGEDFQCSEQSLVDREIEAIYRPLDEDEIERYVECLIADAHACMRCLYRKEAL